MNLEKKLRLLLRRFFMRLFFGVFANLSCA